MNYQSFQSERETIASSRLWMEDGIELILSYCNQKGDIPWWTTRDYKLYVNLLQFIIFVNDWS